jgi:hypothetical protein
VQYHEIYILGFCMNCDEIIVHVGLKFQLDVHGFICILCSPLFFALRVSGAI